MDINEKKKIQREEKNGQDDVKNLLESDLLHD
jgi:hypothetical protein